MKGLMAAMNLRARNQELRRGLGCILAIQDPAKVPVSRWGCRLTSGSRSSAERTAGAYLAGRRQNIDKVHRRCRERPGSRRGPGRRGPTVTAHRLWSDAEASSVKSVVIGENWGLRLFRSTGTAIRQRAESCGTREP